MAWYNSNWKYRVLVTNLATKVLSTQSNFPVMITENNFPAGFWTHVKSDGTDIVVTLSDGTTKLKREVDYILVGTPKLALFVKIPSLSGSTNTSVYIYYGNSGAAETNDTDTWGTYFSRVFHGKDKTGDNSKIIGSTAGANEGLKSSANNPDEITGLITGKAQNFDGDFEYINLGTQNYDEITFEFLVSFNWFTSFYNVISKKNVIHIYTWESGGNYYIRARVTNEDGTYSLTNTLSLGALSLSTTYYMALRYVKATGVSHIYINTGSNGFGPAVVNKTLYQNSEQIRLGAGWYSRCDRMDIGEIRISNTPRSDDWIETTYNNLMDNTNFYTAGAEEAKAGILVPFNILQPKGVF